MLKFLRFLYISLFLLYVYNLDYLLAAESVEGILEDSFSRNSSQIKTLKLQKNSLNSTLKNSNLSHLMIPAILAIIYIIAKCVKSLKQSKTGRLLGDGGDPCENIELLGSETANDGAATQKKDTIVYIANVDDTTAAGRICGKKRWILRLIIFAALAISLPAAINLLRDVNISAKHERNATNEQALGAGFALSSAFWLYLLVIDIVYMTIQCLRKKRKNRALNRDARAAKRRADAANSRAKGKLSYTTAYRLTTALRLILILTISFSIGMAYKACLIYSSILWGAGFLAAAILGLMVLLFDLFGNPKTWIRRKKTKEVTGLSRSYPVTIVTEPPGGKETNV